MISGARYIYSAKKLTIELNFKCSSLLIDQEISIENKTAYSAK